ncbi:MAG: glycosyltransferase family 2 protein [Bacillota bacterium]
MISVVIPTLGTREKELIRLFQSLSSQTLQDFEAIVVSQDNHDKVKELLAPYSFPIQHIKLDQKGLSLSRNVGIKYTKGNIVTFSDDDCWYKSDAFERVQSYFNQHSTGIACFQIYDPEREVYYKEYPKEPQEKISFLELFRKSSIEIFINLSVVDKDKVVFDEDFGLGAKYPSGEENIFLHTMHKEGYNAGYVSEVVVYHAKPSLDTRLNNKAFASKGPMFKRIFNTPIGIALLTLLFLKKLNHLEKPIPFYLNSLGEMFRYKKSRKR